MGGERGNILEPKQIYDSLRQKIIWLELQPESVLNLSELAEMFEVSRTPIKEVLIHLYAEGWVQRQGSHFLVTPLSLDRIREITEIRTVLEVQANLWAMKRIKPDELENLHKWRESAVSMGDQADYKIIVEQDFLFHRLVFSAAKNSQLTSLLERLLGHYLRFWLAIPREINVRQFFTEAVEIIQAIEEKNEEMIKDCTRRHIKNSILEIMGTT